MDGIVGKLDKNLSIVMMKLRHLLFTFSSYLANYDRKDNNLEG